MLIWKFLVPAPIKGYWDFTRLLKIASCAVSWGHIWGISSWGKQALFKLFYLFVHHAASQRLASHYKLCPNACIKIFVINLHNFDFRVSTLLLIEFVFVDDKTLDLLCICFLESRLAVRMKCWESFNILRWYAFNFRNLVSALILFFVCSKCLHHINPDKLWYENHTFDNSAPDKWGFSQFMLAF